MPFRTAATRTRRRRPLAPVVKCVMMWVVVVLVVVQLFLMTRAFSSRNGPRAVALDDRRGRPQRPRVEVVPPEPPAGTGEVFRPSVRSSVSEAQLAARDDEFVRLREAENERIGLDGNVWKLSLSLTTGTCSEASLRVGGSGASGRDVCGAKRLPKHCVVYSLGAGASVVDLPFETELHGVTAGKCEVHLFDGRNLTASRFEAQGITVHSDMLVGLGDDPVAWSKALRDAMTRLGHDRIDLLKVDLDHDEYAFVEGLESIVPRVWVPQILLTLRFRHRGVVPPVPPYSERQKRAALVETIDLTHSMERMGYRLLGVHRSPVFLDAADTAWALLSPTK